MITKTFYEYLMAYRNEEKPDDQENLANWAYSDHSFPKESTNYDELSNYLEWNSPFVNALKTFDELWEIYQLDENNNKI